MTTELGTDDNDIIRIDSLGNVDLRVAIDTDMRMICTLDGTAGSDGMRMSRTDFAHFQLVIRKFYSQNSRLMAKYLGDHLKTTTVLDIGCGDAFGVEDWVLGCGEYHGVDLSYPRLLRARRYIPHERYPNTFFYHADETKVLSDNCADFIISSEVIEHLDSPQHHIESCHRKLKNGGILRLSTPCASLYLFPSYGIPMFLLNPRRFWKLTRAHRYWLDVVDHHPAFTPSALAALLVTNGFEILEHYTCQWFWRTPLRLSMRLSSGLEKIGMSWQISLFRRWIAFLEAQTERQSGPLRWLGTRQIVVARKH